MRVSHFTFDDMRSTSTSIFWIVASLNLSSICLSQGYLPAEFITQETDNPSVAIAEDLDGDGDLDVISASTSDGLVAWYANLGDGTFGAQRIVSSSALGVSTIAVGDVDGDGDPDLISGGLPSGTIVWIENIGGTFGVEQGVPSISGATELALGDLDDDGDLDIVASQISQDRFWWHENLGPGAGFGAQQIISTDVDGVSSLQVFDVDGDGLEDIASTSLNDNKLAWYRNLGGGVFGPQIIISLEADRPRDTVVADLDSDGLDDLALASSGDGRVVFHKNLGGGAFSGQIVVSDFAAGARSLDALDMDGDGDVDLLMGGAQFAPGLIIWYENFGGFSWQGRSVGIPLASPSFVSAADLDGDGDGDVIATVQSLDSIVWYERRGTVDCNANGVLDRDEIATGVADDCNTNLTPDSCEITADATLDLNQNAVIDSCEGIGFRYCSPAIANSTGGSGSLTVLGSELLFFDDVTLSARGLPESSFGFFITSQTSGFAFPVANSQGALCVLGLVGRYVGPGQIQFSGADGSFELPVSSSQIPTPSGLVQAMPGETWNFQAWHRDANPALTSNFTDAVAVTFQ